MRYRATSPSAAVEDATRWIRNFVAWINGGHQHSGIGHVPPAARHTGDDQAAAEARGRGPGT